MAELGAQNRPRLVDTKISVRFRGGTTILLLTVNIFSRADKTGASRLGRERGTPAPPTTTTTTVDPTAPPDTEQDTHRTTLVAACPKILLVLVYWNTGYGHVFFTTRNQDVLHTVLTV